MENSRISTMEYGGYFTWGESVPDMGCKRQYIIDFCFIRHASLLSIYAASKVRDGRVPHPEPVN
ncbi:hypothetical protein CDQ84_13270 [Clostridium thermosuccinogenes]|jgi:hypothetical protein|uniref:Uncharacterized protein n=1 Tax=Clostridium thermosuccinogenes TaxID=84032 RepID=A0A2K2FF75_9CLOT|nr:hypothetical protein CDO33_20075 [Pseudoclostridium thermosuccinogenes]PNT90794.1 hypothetical protein CDQ83_13145 [Pseudoclostridium thermosuccinogenes]PNT95989.1 hypothetical protein CDQ85_13140 [Pseudoclostridium thermosuccinogenes]PNT97416.1 hypothetical protein CDQ84_13270 [Pseudoclostridium thermosuccinogenes]